ncbi:diacylglycerol kinase [Mycolicibacterium agri]|uniref:Diacylglycerol kinase n=2 Tax=Mycolicibacterium agri TaxID=36811 RepID=A0A7I9W1K3_MYCAG|nr:diacylglycerol kinase [Mycolicibacterium agri]
MGVGTGQVKEGHTAMRRVVQFSTGNVGQHSLRAVIGRPDLELVGVHAASPNKIGRDAAELCGWREPTGIVATDDIDALIALQPDCVVYTAVGETRPTEALEQMTKFLAAGINVVATSMVWLVTPRQVDDWLRVPLEQACEQGNASLYVNGIDPGYSGDTQVHSALSLVTRADSITVQEIFDYANYDDYEFTGTSMGFGTTPEDKTPMLFLPGVLTTMWGGPVRNLADQLGVELDVLRQRIEPWYTEQRIECKMATVEPGGLAAVRFAVEGVRDGVPVITMEHITRLTAASAPDWEFPPDGKPGVHRVVVEGEPRVEVNTHVSHPTLDVTEAGCVSTAARVVNVIDWVCRAPKGMLAVEDIPSAEAIRGLMWKA